jgi:hypothetical protein
MALVPRVQGPGVIDMQQAILKRLRSEIDRLKNERTEIIANSKQNQIVQNRIQAAVISIIQASTFEKMIHVVTHELPELLDVDFITLAIEANADAPKRVPVRGVYVLAPGAIDAESFADGRIRLLEYKLDAATPLVAVLAVIYGLKQIAQEGMGWPPLLSILVGLVLGAVFVRRQSRLAEPLIELRLFRAPAFSASLATFALSIFVIAGIFLFIAQYLQLVFGLSPLVAGLWTVPSSSGLIAGSMLAPLVVRRVRPAFVMAGGLALSAVGFGMLTQVDAGSRSS